MYVFYIAFILPIAYCYFLVCEAIAFLPCYIYGSVFLGMTKNWRKFTIWIFAGPLILCYQILRGSAYCILESLQYPEAHLLAYKTLRSEWADSVLLSKPGSETDLSLTNHVQSILTAEKEMVEVKRSMNSGKSSRKSMNSRYSKSLSRMSGKYEAVVRSELMFTRESLHIRPDLYSVDTVAKTIEKVKAKKSVNENLVDLKREMNEIREEFKEIKGFLVNDMT